jgi:hypothetical protein
LPPELTRGAITLITILGGVTILALGTARHGSPWIAGIFWMSRPLWLALRPMFQGKARHATEAKIVNEVRSYLQCEERELAGHRAIAFADFKRLDAGALSPAVVKPALACYVAWLAQPYEFQLEPDMGMADEITLIEPGILDS